MSGKVAMPDEVRACLTERLDRLERSHRRWKRAAAGSAMLLLAAIGLGAARSAAHPRVCAALDVGGPDLDVDPPAGHGIR